MRIWHDISSWRMVTSMPTSLAVPKLKTVQKWKRKWSWLIFAEDKK